MNPDGAPRCSLCKKSLEDKNTYRCHIGKHDVCTDCENKEGPASCRVCADNIIRQADSIDLIIETMRGKKMDQCFFLAGVAYGILPGEYALQRCSPMFETFDDLRYRTNHQEGDMLWISPSPPHTNILGSFRIRIVCARVSGTGISLSLL